MRGLARKVDQKRIVPVFLYYLSSSLLKEVNAVTVIHAKICLQVVPEVITFSTSRCLVVGAVSLFSSPIAIV